MSIAERKSIEGFTLSVSLSFYEIAWGRIRDLLITRHKLDEAVADRGLKRFHEAFLAPFEVYWFKNRELSEVDGTIIAAICEAHGADILSISHKVKILDGLEYKILVQFIPPSSSDGKSASCNPVISAELFGKNITISEAKQLYIMRLSLFLAATFLYVTIVGSTLYTLSLLLIFPERPAETISFVALNPFALLCTIITALVFILGLKRSLSRILRHRSLQAL